MKKLLAILIIIIILSLSISTLVLAILNKPGTDALFKTSIYLTVVIPILIYIFFWIYKILKNRNEKN